ncbi:MAG: leucine-rich repeat protein [Ruminococcus sp.]|nr:leucine-rich repeat protein [Ruminococcus sp.]
MILSGKVLYEINEEDINVEKKTLRIGDGVKEMWDRCNVNIRKEIREQITIIDFNELEAIEKLSGCTVCTVFPNVEVVLMPKVKAVSENMFEKCRHLKQVDMISAEFIHEAAFRGCIELQEVHLPSIRCIHRAAFADCISLNTVSLGKTTKGIRVFAFSNTAIETIDLGDANVDLKAFDSCEYLQSLSINTLQYFDRMALTDCYAFKKLLVKDEENAFIEKAPAMVLGHTYSLVYDSNDDPFAPYEKHMICCAQNNSEETHRACEYVQIIHVGGDELYELYVLKNEKYVARHSDGSLSRVSNSIASL